MYVIDGCECSAWLVLTKKPPVEQEAKLNPEPVWTQKQYRSSNPDSPVILVTIPIYRLKRKLRGEGRSLQLLRPKRKRSELRDVCCLRRYNLKSCANVQYVLNGRFDVLMAVLWNMIPYGLRHVCHTIPMLVSVCLPNCTTAPRTSLSIYCKAVPLQGCKSLRAPGSWGSQNFYTVDTWKW